MALKNYAYYIRGNQIALIQEDYTNDSRWKSPVEAITDGLEIEYAYSPRYFINETDKVDTQIDTYVSTDGLVKLIDQGDNDYSASPESLSDGSYIVLKKAGKWNGLHRVKAAGTGYITLYTKCSDSSTVQQSFEEIIDLYYNVDAFVDESFDLDLTRYQANAIVYYLKAKMAEDTGDMELREYFLRELKKQLEKGKSALKRGPYIVQGLKEMR